MAYTITLTDGAVLAVVPDGTVNQSASTVALVGKNYAGYGQFLNENFVFLLENSSNTTAPPTPLTGQLWWDSSTGLMKAYNGSTWKTISSATSSASAPSGNALGDLWFDTTNQQLNVWTGSAWLIVGPAYTSTQGISGAIALTINDVGSTPHFVTGLYAANTLVSIVSPDTSFVPAAPYSTAFPTVFKGTTTWNTGATGGNIVNTGNVYVTAAGNATLNVTAAGANITGYTTVSGNATVANMLTGGLISATGNITGGNIATAGAFGSASLSASGNVTGGNILTGGLISATATVTGGNLATGGFASATANITGGNILTGGIMSSTGNAIHGNILTGGYVSATGNVTSGNLVTAGTTGILSVNSIVHTGSNAVGNIGSDSSYFNQVFATATTALYADVAERFAADEVLDAGTVVELGGSAEITKSQQELSENVFGVISTRAAYLMNGGAGTNDTHPPVAMTGRVPVQVTGMVRKGDRLVSAGNGHARAAMPGEATAFNVIGRALVDKPSSGFGTVEAIVTIK